MWSKVIPNRKEVISTLWTIIAENPNLKDVDGVLIFPPVPYPKFQLENYKHWNLPENVKVALAKALTHRESRGALVATAKAQWFIAATGSNYQEMFEKFFCYGEAQGLFESGSEPIPLPSWWGKTWGVEGTVEEQKARSRKTFWTHQG